MEYHELKQMQSLPLHLKIHKTCARIQEWYEAHDGMVYVAFSGGLDSTVLSDIVHRMYPEVPLVFSNTGLEYPEIVRFVKTHSPLEIIRPEHPYRWIIEKYGYPVVSKRVSRFIEDLQNPTEKNAPTRNLRLTGMSTRQHPGQIQTAFMLPKKWHFLVNSPFRISDKCCDVIKKHPLKKYAKASGRVPMTGELAEESKRREKTYLQRGCNSFGREHKSTPLGFWTHQDILSYLLVFRVPYCPVYGDITHNAETNLLETTGEKRTGCYACMFGVHLEKNGNRFTRMKVTHPKLYDLVINRYGQGKILDYMGVEH